MLYNILKSWDKNLFCSDYGIFKKIMHINVARYLYEPQYLLDKRLVGSRAHLDAVEKRRSCLASIRSWALQPVAHHYLTELSQLPHLTAMGNINMRIFEEWSFCCHCQKLGVSEGKNKKCWKSSWYATKCPARKRTLLFEESLLKHMVNFSRTPKKSVQLFCVTVFWFSVCCSDHL